jgi:hypothetical protein
VHWVLAYLSFSRPDIIPLYTPTPAFAPPSAPLRDTIKIVCGRRKEGEEHLFEQASVSSLEKRSRSGRCVLCK